MLSADSTRCAESPTDDTVLYEDMSRTNKEKTMFRGIDRSLFGFRMRPAVLQTGRACSFLLGALVLVRFLSGPAHGHVRVLTQKYDNGRSGAHNHETTLTP